MPPDLTPTLPSPTVPGVREPVGPSGVVIRDPATGVAIAPMPRIPDAPPIADRELARVIQAAQWRLSRPGADAKAIHAQALAEHPGYVAETRDAATQQIDRSYGIDPTVDASRYVAVPPVTVTDPAARMAASRDLGSVAAALRLDTNAGNSLIGAISAEIAAGDNLTKGLFPDQLAHVVAEKIAGNEARIAAMFKDEAERVAAVKSVNDLLDGLKGKAPEKLLDGLRPGKVVCSPSIFFSLLSRANRLGAWQAARGGKV